MTLTHRFRALLGAVLLSALPFVAGTSTAFASTDPQTLTFGVAPGPYGDMVNLTIKPQLEKKGAVREKVPCCVPLTCCNARRAAVSR